MENIKQQLKRLPKKPGVYIFRDASRYILYIGKATSLRDRAGSYFSGPHENRIEAMVVQIAKIGFQETDTVLEALILEANLIKKYQPKYNVKERDDKSFAYFAITKDKFPRVLIVRKTEVAETEVKKFYGPYLSKKQMQIALKLIRRIFPFHSITQKTEKGCLDFQLGRCPGPYADAITKKDYNRNIRGIRMILEGKKQSLIRKLRKEMKDFSKEHRYEKAAETRNKIFALEHIQDIALITRDMEPEKIKKSLRIEAYDISNIGGQQAVGSMVVFNQDRSVKAEYRKFKIKTVNGSDDVGMMREVLLRRFKNPWSQPDLIILDGGKGHLNMAQKLLLDLGMIIPLVSVAKGPTRKKLEVHIGNYKLNKEINNILTNEAVLKRITDEAHRFAISYHKKIRKREFIK